MTTRTGAQVLVDQLLIQKVTDIFCVPGESYLAVLDALHDASVRVTVCRQEAGAGFMADAVGRLTGRPGIVFVTRGPGATNAAHAIHVARQDSIPLIMFVGQIERGMREREAFQEVDYRAAFGPLAKWATEIDDAGRIPELVARAFSVAMSGRPGPVVIALPEDMLVDAVDVPDAPFVAPIETHPGPETMAALHGRLLAAKSPIVLVGGTRWDEEARSNLITFAERFDLPVATSLRRQMLFPHDHRCFAGDLGIGANPKLVARIKAADLIIGVNTRLSEMPSQSYTLLDIPGDGARFVHVHPDAGELNRVYASSLPIHATPKPFAAALAGLAAPDKPVWAAQTTIDHEAYLAFSGNPAPTSGDFHPGLVVQWLRANLPDDAIMTNGAGNYATWLHR
ncbi:MAG: thiamine pyrophosphate-binding protein, partial [Proteobacteria bacterium]|nr:thiamine pyrophosphate-binding protein [Pseudomonadota bacterium]